MQSISKKFFIHSLYFFSYYSFGLFFFFSSRRRHTIFSRDWSSDVCSSDLAGQAVMAGAARDDGPDVDDHLIADDVVGVVPVHGARRVPRHQRHGVTDPQGRPLGGGEDAVLLIETQDLEVVAGDGHVGWIGDRLVTRVDDHLVALAADDGRLDRERVLEAWHHPAVEVV